MDTEKKNWTKEILIAIIGAMAIIIAALFNNLDNLKSFLDPSTPVEDYDLESTLNEVVLPYYEGTDMNPEILAGFLEGVDVVNEGKQVIYFHYRPYTEDIHYVDIHLPANEEIYLSIMCEDTYKIFGVSIIYEDDNIPTRELNLNSSTILSFTPDYPVHAISISLPDDNIFTKYGFMVSQYF